MATPAHDKYYLKTLHEEIDLFDRKLAHMLKYDTFNSDAERKTSTDKMTAKRNLLARTAKQLVSEGIEFKNSELPRSFRGEETDATAPQAAEPSAAKVSEPEVVPSPQPLAATGRPSPSPFAGTVLDGKANVDAYKRARTKALVPQH